MNEQAFAEHLEWAEGRRKKLYRCPAGKWSIGIGRNVEDNGLNDDEIDFLLAQDIDRVQRQAAKLRYWPALNDARQIVVCDMIFNLGLAGFLAFTKLQAALDEGNWKQAAAEMIDSRWYGQVGRRAKRLIEAMQTGIWK